MSWPQIGVILTLGFVLGALWMRARQRDIDARRKIEVRYPLPVQWHDSSTEYYRGRQPAERVGR